MFSSKINETLIFYEKRQKTLKNGTISATPIAYPMRIGWNNAYDFDFFILRGTRTLIESGYQLPMDTNH